MLSYCEYPEPVIASYLKAVRALPVPPETDDVLVNLRAASRRGGLRRRLANTVAVVGLTASTWLSLTSSTWTVQDRRAKAAYRSLLAELKKRGWTPDARQRVAYGLTALRCREMTGANGERLYAMTMERAVPRNSIGWHSPS
jgi:hypothetical protein